MELITHSGAVQRRMQPREVLGLLTVESITEKIRAFRRTEIRDLSDEQLAAAISDVFSVEVPGGKVSYLNVRPFEIPAGTILYRARRAEDGSVPPKSGRLIRDSGPPNVVAREGRLNKAGEPILYTAINNALVPLQECRIAINGHAVIFAYRARRVIKAPKIGAVESGVEFDRGERIKLNLINDFLHDEFAREVEVGLEHLYRSSQIVAKWWFDGPDSKQDCWVYSSTKNRNLLNAAFRPNKAHECLDVFGSLLVERISERSFKIISVGKAGRKRFEYFDAGSPEHLALFPDIR